MCSVFHLAHRLANRSITIMHKGSKLKFDREPVYLGVALYRSLTFKPHLQGVTNKTRKRVNLIDKLAGSTWGGELCHHPHIYSCPRLFHGGVLCCGLGPQLPHQARINESLSLITGCLVPTPVEMLPVLAGIAPSHIRRNYAVLKLAEKSFQPDSLVPLPAPLMHQLSDFAEKPSPLKQEPLPTLIHCHHHGWRTAGPTSGLSAATPCGSL